MNKKLIIKVLGAILLIEAIAMIPSMIIGLIYRDPDDASAIAVSIGFLVLFGLPSWLFMKPDEKISLTDAFAMLAYRYEGTEHDANLDPTVRAIGGESTCESAIFQYKPSGTLVQWTAMANPEHSVFLPVLGAISETPEMYHVTGAEYNEASAYWVFRGLCTLSEIDRTYCGEGVKAVWKQYQQELIDKVDALDAEYLALDKDSKAAMANKLLADTLEEAVGMATLMKNELMYYLAANSSLAKTPKAPFTPSG